MSSCGKVKYSGMKEKRGHVDGRSRQHREHVEPVHQLVPFPVVLAVVQGPLLPRVDVRGGVDSPEGAVLLMYFDGFSDVIERAGDKVSQDRRHEEPDVKLVALSLVHGQGEEEVLGSVQQTRTDGKDHIVLRGQ